MSKFRFKRGDTIRLLADKRSDLYLGWIYAGTTGEVTDMWSDENDGSPWYGVNLRLGHSPSGGIFFGTSEIVPEHLLGYETPLDDLVNALSDEL